MIKFIKHFLIQLTTAFCICGQVLGQTASLLPPGVLQLFDNNGNPLSAGTIDTYIVGTTTRKTTWKNSAESIVNTNPIVLDAGGKAIVYGEGSYRTVVKDRNGNLIWDAVTAPSGGGGSSSSTGDGDLVGTIKPWAGITAPNQYVFAYGQEISRSTYSVFYTAITQALTVSCSNGSNIITAISDTTEINIGSPVELICVTPGTTVTAKTSSTVTLSNPATITINAVGTFFPFGNGNGTTTFNVPDLRGYVIAGRNNMGGTGSSNLEVATTLTTTSGSPTATVISATGLTLGMYILSNNVSAGTTISAISGTTITMSTNANGTANNAAIFSIFKNPDAQAAVGGAASHIQVTAELASHTHTIVDPGHSHGGLIQPHTISGGSSVIVPSSVGGSPVAGAVSAAATGITLNSTGSSTPFSIIQPTIILNYIIKITPDTNSAIATGVTSLGGMTGDIACGSGLLCTGNNISVSGLGVSAPANTVLSNATSATANMLPFVMPSCSAVTNALIWTTNSGFGCNTLGTVSSGTAGQLGWYASTGTTISGNASANMASGALTLGQIGSVQGQLKLAGSGSGTAIITTAAANGSPTITLGTSSGTPAVTASSPLGITTATGNITCATCVTSSGGGAITGTAPIAVSAAGVVSINAPYQSLTASNGGIVYSDATNLNILAGTANANRPLLSGSSTLPSWASVSYLTSTATSGGVIYASSTTQLASSALLAANQLVLGGGAGTAPATLGSLGTTTTLLHGNAGGAPSFSSVVSADLNITTTTCTNQFVTAISSGGVGTCTTATLASAQFANQGTTTTLLHGNAAGNPSFSAVSLTADVTGTLPLGSGGTGRTTALAARDSSGLNIDACTSTGDANYTILSTDRCVYHTALSAARTDTLPAANALNAGQTLYILDFRGVATASNTITLSRAGSDTINGGTTFTALNAANGTAECWSDGSSRWACQAFSSGGGGGVSSVTIAAGTGIGVSGTCTITSSGTCTVGLSSAYLTLPTTDSFLTAATNQTVTLPANVLWMKVRMVGGGGGGASGDSGSDDATDGGATCFNATGGTACGSALYSAGGGTHGVRQGAPGSGGTVTGSATPYLKVAGGYGGPLKLTSDGGSNGGSSALGGAGAGGNPTSGNATNGSANTGGGGGGGGGTTGRGQPGGGSGAYLEFIINNPSASYLYTIGAAGVGSTSGSGTGGNGGSGGMWLEYHYNP